MIHKNQPQYFVTEVYITVDIYTVWHAAVVCWYVTVCSV